jgi:hypothetical protein
MLNHQLQKNCAHKLRNWYMNYNYMSQLRIMSIKTLKQYRDPYETNQSALLVNKVNTGTMR